MLLAGSRVLRIAVGVVKRRNRARGEIDIMLELGLLARQVGGPDRFSLSVGERQRFLAEQWPSIRASFGLPLDALGLLLATFATGYFVASAVSGRVIGRFGVGRVRSSAR